MSLKKYLSLKLVLLTLLTVNISYAETCNDILKDVIDDNTYEAIINKAHKTLQKALTKEPMPITSDISLRRKQSWTGLQGPKALKRFLANGVSFMKTPDPNTEHPLLAMRKHPGVSSLLHAEVNFKGQKTSTKVYVSRPIAEANSHQVSGEYLIGPEHKSVIWHVHGGGTPSAVAANASSKANYYIKRGIPTLAVDQPGHGNGPVFPFLNDEEIFEWNYELMKKLIHPDVEIHFHGHSWGGMKATRLWQLSNQEKFNRIVAYQAESPGADISLGKGGPKEKARLESEVNKNMHDWEQRAAASDIDFLKNVVDSRKMSPVAQEYTFLTDIFYRWGHLSQKEVSQRKRLNVLVGTYDGLVYVGREKIYDYYYTRMAGNNYFKFSKGKTFKGDAEETGHQIFDLLDDSGDFVAYKIGVNLVNEISGQDVAVRNIEGDAEDTISIINKYFNNYANNFAFREYVQQHTEYIEQYKGIHGQMIQETQALKSYSSEIQRITKDHEGSLKQTLEKELKSWGAQFNVKDGVEKAKREFAIDNSPARKKELQIYIEEIINLEKEFKETYHDSKYQVSLTHLSDQFDSLMGEGLAQRIFKHEDISDAHRAVTNLVRKQQRFESSSTEFTSMQATIDKIYNNLEIDKNKGSLEYLTSQMNHLKRAPDIFKSDKEKKLWKRTFEKASQDYKLILKDKRTRLNEALQILGEKIKSPIGITRKAEAQWELSQEVTSKRKTELLKYIDGHLGFIEQRKKILKLDFDTQINEVAFPKGMSTKEDVEVRLTELLDTLKKRFRPSKDHQNYSQIDSLVTKLQTLDKEFVTKNPETTSALLSIVDKQLKSLKKERSQEASRVDKLLEQAKPSLKLQESMDKYQQKLNKLITVNTSYAKNQEEFYLNLFETKMLTKENILNRPKSLSDLALSYEQALKEADTAALEMKQVKLSQARAGLLSSDQDPNGEQLKNSLEKLLNNESGLELKITKLSKEYQQLETKMFRIRIKVINLEREYQSLFTGNNANQDFYSVHAIKVNDLLDQDYEQLVKLLNSQDGKKYKSALKKSLKLWENLWNRVNAEDNLKTTDAY